ncbi:protein FAM102A [Octopus bimaculoides]|nr:protein FAM102A isoform X2 [Octopus sinensis]XP_052821529.1 protein FAM102A [Octopus bimaculoides]
MVSFMSKKKRYKFNVNFTLDELSSVPFVSGILFAKVRLLDGGNYTHLSSRVELANNCVKWGCQFCFLCKMTANASNVVLEPCICRVSIRKELKGGRSYQKLGFADINLSEFAGAGILSRKYLLNGYDYKNRQDNSTLKVTIEMTLLSGDPVFKVEKLPQSVTFSADLRADHGIENKVDSSEGSLASNSSGFGSLPRKDKPNIAPLEVPPILTDPEGARDVDFEKSHSRNSSYASQHSRGSGYGSLGHSRQSSLSNDIHGHTRSPSAGSALNDSGKIERRRKLEDPIERRVDSTRVDAEDLVEELIKGTDLRLDDSEERSGLQLFIDTDGKTALR